MSIDEFSASIRCGEDTSGSLRALVSARRKKFTADADPTCSPLAPVFDRAPAIDCRRRARAAEAPLGGPLQHRTLWARPRIRIQL
jgi:hypothetical protein